MSEDTIRSKENQPEGINPISEKPEKNSSMVNSQPQVNDEDPSEEKIRQDPFEVIRTINEQPRQIKESIYSLLALFSRTDGDVDGPASLFPKFKDEHITTWLEGLRIESEHDYQLKKSTRWVILVYVIVVLFALGLLIQYLHPKDPELVTNLIILFVVVGTSIGAGIGISEKLKK